MLEKFIDIQAKILAYIAFSDNNTDEKERTFYVNFLNTLEIPKNKESLYQHYLNNPPSFEDLTKDVSKTPFEINLSCIKNAYLMAMSSNGLCENEKEALIRLGKSIGLIDSKIDLYFDMLDKYFQVYLLGKEIFTNINPES